MLTEQGNTGKGQQREERKQNGVQPHPPRYSPASSSRQGSSHHRSRSLSPAAAAAKPPPVSPPPPVVGLSSSASTSNAMTAVPRSQSPVPPALPAAVPVAAPPILLRPAIETAFKQLEQEAGFGDIDKQFVLGWMFDTGYELRKPNVQLAEKWYTKAAEGGHSLAQYNLAVLFFLTRGVGISFDLTKALYWLDKACSAKGLIEAKVYRAFLWETGTAGLPRNGHNAERYYIEAAEQYKNVDAYFRLGMYYKSQKQFIKAIDWLAKAAAEGYPGAYCAIGEMFEQQRNPKEAIKAYEKALANKEPQVFYYLGRYHAKKIGVEKVDEEQALRYFQQGADLGCVFCQNEVGIHYANEESKDPAQSQIHPLQRKSIFWFLKAAYQGYRSAQSNVANVFLRNVDPELQEKGIGWSYHAMRQGSQRAYACFKVWCQHNESYIQSENFHRSKYGFLGKTLAEVLKSAQEVVEKAKAIDQGPISPIAQYMELQCLPAGTPEGVLRFAATRGDFSLYKSFLCFPGFENSDMPRIHQQAFELARVYSREEFTLALKNALGLGPENVRKTVHFMVDQESFLGERMLRLEAELKQMSEETEKMKLQLTEQTKQIAWQQECIDARNVAIRANNSRITELEDRVGWLDGADLPFYWPEKEREMRTLNDNLVAFDAMKKSL